MIDPLESLAGTAAGVASGLSRRDKFSETIDQILYQSADSYALSRSIYLQNRRFQLGGTGGETYTDPYDALPAGASSAVPSSVPEGPYDE